jgi:hypothetical protein
VTHSRSPSVFLVSTVGVLMCPAIDNNASCEIRVVISFLYTNNMAAREIQHGLCALYGQIVIREGSVRR